MCIDLIGGLYVPYCDMCGGRLPGEDDFSEAVKSKKQAGWRSRKIEGEWWDMCQDCLEEQKRGGCDHGKDGH